MQDTTVLNAVTSTGGLIIVGIGMNLLKITKIRIGSFLLVIFYAVAWAVLM